MYRTICSYTEWFPGPNISFLGFIKNIWFLDYQLFFHQGYKSIFLTFHHIGNNTCSRPGKRRLLLQKHILSWHL